ncbi:MAG: hypothetical protein AAF389_14745 [Gemmatimonadota bacterium]
MTDEQMDRHIALWCAVLGHISHVGGCRFRVDGITYDLSASGPEKWDLIRADHTEDV